MSFENKGTAGNMQFSIFYRELQYSTQMIRALLAGIAPEAARLKPSAELWSILELGENLYNRVPHHQRWRNVRLLGRA
jgi:hypothetical protein